jgi:hypothetical protein
MTRKAKMNKTTQSFEQWKLLLEEWLNSKDIAMWFDELTQLFHAGYSVQEASDLIVLKRAL